MSFAPLPLRSSLEDYRRQAEDLLIDMDTLAGLYEFRDRAELEEFVAAIHGEDSSVYRFELAADAVVAGDAAELRPLLSEDPALTKARSMRRHHATLLHYTAANGVEEFRQRTPANAVKMARILLQAGADVDALADMYGGRCTTLSMLVSSCHPAEAGLQAPLAEVLLDAGAAIEGRGEGRWSSPLMTTLAFGYGDTAAALVRRGARVDSLPAAAGLGRLEDARRMLPQASPEERHRALALAAQHGRAAVVGLLLDAGEDPNRYNPEGNHSHSTPLHQAVWAGRLDAVRLLVERGAKTDIRDTAHQGTPLDWAIYGKQSEIERYLRAAGAS